MALTVRLVLKHCFLVSSNPNLAGFSYIQMEIQGGNFLSTIRLLGLFRYQIET